MTQPVWQPAPPVVRRKRPRPLFIVLGVVGGAVLLLYGLGVVLTARQDAQVHSTLVGCEESSGGEYTVNVDVTNGGSSLREVYVSAGLYVGGKQFGFGNTIATVPAGETARATITSFDSVPSGDVRCRVLETNPLG